MDLLPESCKNRYMSRTILLELSEKEAEFIREVIALEKEAVDKSDSMYAEKQRKTGICNSFLAKVDLASLPPQDFLISFKDLAHLVSLAKGEHRELRADIHISSKKVDESDFKHISLASAVIMWLNSKNLLKRIAKFDYTDQSYQYEEMDE